MCFVFPNSLQDTLDGFFIWGWGNFSLFYEVLKGLYHPRDGVMWDFIVNMFYMPWDSFNLCILYNQ